MIRLCTFIYRPGRYPKFGEWLSPKIKRPHKFPKAGDKRSRNSVSYLVQEPQGAWCLSVLGGLFPKIITDPELSLWLRLYNLFAGNFLENYVLRYLYLTDEETEVQRG